MSLLSPEEYLATLAQIRDGAQQRAFISSADFAPTSALVEKISIQIRELSRKDPALAQALAETSLYLAALIDTPAVWAFATRSRAHVLNAMRRCAEAQPDFERAAELFTEAGLDAEAGRTLVAEMDNLLYLSRYEEATALESRARGALIKANDTRYLATLEVALGNLYYRLNRYIESLEHYDAARDISDDPIVIAAIGINRAHVLTDRNLFDEALEAFESTKQHCEQHGLALWTDIANRGMSKMHFLRGNYSTALRLIEQVRLKHEAAHDSMRVGFCDQDRAEIYLQLNLFKDASTLAASAFETFERLGNLHEAGVCLMFLGIAEFKLLHDEEAERAFVRARNIFIRERNDPLVAAVDLWRAQLLIRQQQFAGARELSSRAAEVYEKQQVPVRAANARVLSAQSLQKLADTPSAIADAERALHELQGFHAPWVAYQALNTLGQLKESDGATHEAEDLYLRAVSELESLRGNIRLDELRMSFGKDKYQVYENIVNLKLNRGDDRAAFDFVERSKSRTLIDLLERNLETVWSVGSDQSPHSHRVRKIREELNILYSRANEASAPRRSADSNTTTADEIASRERELVELLRKLGSEKSGWATFQAMVLPSVEQLQEMLHPDELIIEYYSVADRLQAFVIGREDFQVVRDLTTTASVRASLKGLNFQLSKFHMQPGYLDRHAPLLLAAVRYHLEQLHRELLAPLRHLTASGKRLNIVPHQVLHYVPFHALSDGQRYVIDDHDITYAASASVLKICRDRRATQEPEHDLILAVVDENTPHIGDEVEALRQLLPTAKIFVGVEAREDKLRQYGPTAGKIHIAAHGIFRADNPMFSSLRLGDSWLNLFDIFNLQLGAELTTLSACETGMSAVFEGDELLGLARGFLYAGTPSLVVSLWMVNDRSTSQMMKRFYEGLRDGLTKSGALRQAILQVKEDFPHPYFWAPFILLGKS